MKVKECALSCYTETCPTQMSTPGAEKEPIIHSIFKVFLPVSPGTQTGGHQTPGLLRDPLSHVIKTHKILCLIIIISLRINLCF